MMMMVMMNGGMFCAARASSSSCRSKKILLDSVRRSASTLLLVPKSPNGKKGRNYSPSFPTSFFKSCPTTPGPFQIVFQQTSSSAFSTFRPHHDIGGDESAYGPILGGGEINSNMPDNKDLLAWEQQCHSLFAVLASKKVVGTDELRRAIESLTPDQYERYSYYEKWTAAMVSLLLEHGTITHDELQLALFGSSSNSSQDDNVTIREDDESPRFGTGDFVRVKQYLSNAEWRRPHIRTPGYIYGVAGTIERVCGQHGDPSFLAFGLEAPKVQLYRVRFRQKDIWPEQFEDPGGGGGGAADSTTDMVEVEVYEHWLEPAEQATGHSFEDEILFDHTSGDDCAVVDHDSTHAHSHSHHHHGGDEEDVHVHEARPTVESRAIQREGPPTPGKELFQTLYQLLLKKGIVSSDEVRLMCERMDTAAQKLDGASLVVKAWTDPEFEERLLSDAASAAAEIGISTSNPNAPTVLTVLKSTPTVHNLVVCTLCSCYPSGLLGIAPSWYKSREYRSRAVREPRGVLEEFGVSLPNDASIRIHDSTADHRYIVLPVRPEGTENWSEDELRSLVTRDTMIGVAVAALRKE
jgi:nitrile hydratase